MLVSSKYNFMVLNYNFNIKRNSYDLNNIKLIIINLLLIAKVIIYIYILFNERIFFKNFCLGI